MRHYPQSPIEALKYYGTCKEVVIRVGTLPLELRTKSVFISEFILMTTVSIIYYVMSG